MELHVFSAINLKIFNKILFRERKFYDFDNDLITWVNTNIWGDERIIFLQHIEIYLALHNFNTKNY